MKVDLTKSELAGLFSALLYHPYCSSDDLAAKLFSNMWFYHRAFKVDHKAPAGSKRNYRESVITGPEALRIAKSIGVKDLVCLETGESIISEYTKAHPQWLAEPLIRALALTSKSIPTDATRSQHPAVQ